MSYIERSPAELAAQVISIRGKRSRAVRIALGLPQDVHAGHGEVAVEPVRDVENQLVLFEYPARLILKYVAYISERSNAAVRHGRIEGSRQRSIDVSQTQIMHTPRVHVRRG